MLLFLFACTSGKADSAPTDSADTDTDTDADTDADTDTDTATDSGDTGPIVHDPLPVNRVCFIPSGASATSAGDPTYTLTVSGTITGAGTGEPPGGCRDRPEWLGMTTLEWGESETQWLEIEDSLGDVYVAGITNPWMIDPSPLVGLPATVDYRSVLPEGESGIAEESELSLAVPGFLFWLGSAEDFSGLHPTWSDLTLEAGPEEYQETGKCGTWSVSSLRGTRAGVVHDIETGGDYEWDGVGVWSGGVVANVELTCSETTFQRVSVAERAVE